MDPGKTLRLRALRTVWNEPGVSGYLGSSRMWRAQSWSDFIAARNAWGAPPLNLVYARHRRHDRLGRGRHNPRAPPTGTG